MNGTEALSEMAREYQASYGDYHIAVPTPVGYFKHEPTKAQISVYSKIGWFKRLMLKWCFGLRYVNDN